jgi:hypothetical protein
VTSKRCARILRIPYLDPIDLRYRNRVRTPVPTARAVMFCLMDVSGSMDEARKDLAKRFFILLYLFLTRHYERSTWSSSAITRRRRKSDEHDFFHATETGGTVVSSALVLMEEIIRARYPSSEWNIYGAHASDGDNWHNDSTPLPRTAGKEILPLCRYFAYIQVVEQEQNLWQEYAALAASSDAFAMRKASTADQIYPVFRDLFSKEGASKMSDPTLRHERPPPPRAVGGQAAGAKRLDLRTARSSTTRSSAAPPALRTRHLSQPARDHHRRTDDGRLCLGRHAGQLPPLELRQGVHCHRPKNYRRGQMGLAYEIVINANPCISYLMEENTMAMQALVIAHAAYGHNSFFKGNYLFRMWTDASSIIDYLVYAKDYVAGCEERHGVDAVELLLDSCHA